MESGPLPSGACSTPTTGEAAAVLQCLPWEAAISPWFFHLEVVKQQSPAMRKNRSTQSLQGLSRLSQMDQQFSSFCWAHASHEWRARVFLQSP